MADVKEYETWKNVCKGTLSVWQHDVKGNLVRKRVRGGQTFNVTPEERALNTDRCYDETNDFFKNGFAVPVRLLEGTEDKAEISSNPNLLGESDLKDLFSGHWKTFEKRVGEITNVMAIERMISMVDDEEVDASVKQMNVLKARRTELKYGGDEHAEPVEIEQVGRVGQLRGESGVSSIDLDRNN